MGGDFTDAGGDANADYIARWDGAAWHALGSGLNDTVYAIAVAGSNVYVGGSFTDAGGDANADHIARWDGSAWHALGSGLNDAVYAIAVAGPDVYVGGEFYRRRRGRRCRSHRPLGRLRLARPGQRVE